MSQQDMDLSVVREEIARVLHDAATGLITPDETDATPYGRMAAAVVDEVLKARTDSRVAYLEARVGELHQKLGDARELAEKRLVAREDWKARCLSAEASRRDWAAIAMRQDMAAEAARCTGGRGCQADVHHEGCLYSDDACAVHPEVER